MGETKGLLVVSFGTSYAETRKRTIEALERDLALAFPDYRIYRAFTSRMIIKKLKKQGLAVMTVPEALKAMEQDGIRQVLIQPTHVINGIENDGMREEARQMRGAFESIFVGDPLLTSHRDNEEAIGAVMEEFKDLDEDEALVFMGHGSDHYANSVYAALDYMFKDMGYKNVFVGTVEAYPSVESLSRMIKDSRAKRIVLAPFMIVAGDHANNDMAGEDEDSWKSRFEKAGYPVECRLKGLGEYPGIRQIFVRHAKEAKGIE